MLLIIDSTQSGARTAADIFNFMGVVSYGTTPSHASAEFNNRHRAILFIHPELMTCPKEIVELARTYSLDIPIFAILDDCNNSELIPLFDKVFPDGLISSKIVYDILTYQTNKGNGAIGTYRLAGIEASVHNGKTTYFDIPITLTKTETMVLRYLIASFPIARKAQDILKYAFRCGKAPEPSSIRAHISAINKKFMEISERYIISSERGEGYKILAN